MTRDVVECLKGLRGIEVVGDAVSAGAKQVPQCMDLGFVALLVWIGPV